MSKDSELDRLMAKRLAEMQKNISSKQQATDEQDSPEPNPNSPRDVVLSKLGYRGAEVLNNAELQFPHETKLIVQKLAELIGTGEINEILDGGKLLLLFRSVGLNVKMNIKINVEQDGKFVSLSDKLGKPGDESS